MSFDSGSLPDDIEELKRIIANQNNLLEERNAALRDYSIEVKILKEKVTLLQSRLFSKKSEKLGPIEQRQALLFNEIETLHDSHPELPLDEEPVIVTSHQRNKKRKKRIPDDLERREEIIDIPETEKLCTDTTVTKRIVNHFDMKRKDFLDKCKQIIGQKVPQTTLDHFENASKVRDHSMHGKEPSDSKLRTGLRDSLFYCSELHNYATQHAGFSPFGDMRGLSGRKGKLPPETSRLVLKGLGFSTT